MIGVAVMSLIISHWQVGKDKEPTVNYYKEEKLCDRERLEKAPLDY